ncbi:MAG: DUF1570 domain-containing protein [Planctomycetota bacterium]
MAAGFALVPAATASGPDPEPPASPRFTIREAAAPARGRDRPRLTTRGAMLTRFSSAYRNTRSNLPDRFREHETRRFVILSDADERWTRTQAERLERAHHQFERFARRLGVKPEPLRHKLVCVLFQSRNDYRRFALEHDEVTDPRIAGYYAPRRDRVVFYHVESNPSLADARVRLDELRRQADDVGERLDDAVRRGNRRQADSLRQTLNQYRDHLEREQLRVDDFADRVSVTTTIHEAIHQLMFHTRLQSRQLQYPLWICEGLATSFETNSPSAAFGPDDDFAPRREQFREHLAAGDLLPLRKFVTLTSVPGDSEEPMSVIYHQSYALVTWMFRFRRGQLRSYLEIMADEPTGIPSSKRQLALFERAFGNVQTLENAWLRHERNELEKVSASEDVRRVLLNDAVLAQMESSGVMRPDALARLRRYASSGQTAWPPSATDDRTSDGPGGDDPSTTVMTSGIIDD